MNETNETSGLIEKTTPPSTESSIKQRLLEEKVWVAAERQRLTNGQITEDVFDANIALKIVSKEIEGNKKDQLIESLRSQIYEDDLVEAESEEALQLCIDELIGNGECFGVILGDIDHFRDVNTEAGHKGGDNAIIKVAERMSRALRLSQEENNDRPLDRFFRRHGDEFAIIIRNLTPDMEGKKNLKEAMERVREEVAKEPIEIENDGQIIKKHLTVSLGGAVTPQGTSVHPDKFIHLVDTQGLYQAKDEGRNTTFVVNYDKPKTLAA